MGRIKKVASERHNATLSPFVRDFVQKAAATPLHALPSLLDSFPQNWPLPRGDLYHWIPLLDRFDHVIELFNKEYGLNEGPQTQPFQRRLLERGDAGDGLPYPSDGAQSKELEDMGYAADGDRALIESIIHFSRVLLEHCGNRSLYASSSHINDLLHTTSLSLLHICLKLSLRLAQRYQVARLKSHHHPAAQASLLANHYNFNLENLVKIAAPFPRPTVTTNEPVQTPGKAKERAYVITNVNCADLVSFVKSPLSPLEQAELSNVSLTYYEQSSTKSRPTIAQPPVDGPPATPTPVRRTSALGPSRDRPSVGDRSLSATQLPASASRTREADQASSSAPSVCQISASVVAQSPAWQLVQDALQSVPSDSRYDLLHRIRIAKAFATEHSDVVTLVEIRLLAVANLAYALSESRFQEKIGLADSEEPRRYHLAQQLCDMLQPVAGGLSVLPLQAETTVLMTIEALCRSKHKISEVADALAITVNHGMLYYELRKAIATLRQEELASKAEELKETEWRDATFDLIHGLMQAGAQYRYGERMVSAGIIGILAEALEIRTSRADKFHEKVLQFFDTFVHGIASALQALANAKGLDIIADLTSYEVQMSLADVRNGNGLPADFKSKVVDYTIPYYKQSALRQLFKNTAHMFDHHTGTQDRLLRNLIDTPQTLGALRSVVENATVFGSNVWSGAVSIVNQFINHEPTMYQVIGEAGLTKSFLESVIGQPLSDGANSVPSNPADIGILPVGEVMSDIPSVFGAICLNESGMQAFQSSGVLMRYFDIFLSPAHVRAMEEDSQFAATIGNSFDELSRHQPRLKDEILAAFMHMLKRLKTEFNSLAKNEHVGAKLWELTDGSIQISGGAKAMQGLTTSSLSSEASPSDQLSQAEHEVLLDDGSDAEQERAPGMLYLSAVFKFLDGFLHNNSMCAAFCESSGAELLLDLALSPCTPHDLVSFSAFAKIAGVFKTMCDARPHLVLPSLLKRTQNSILLLKDLMSADNTTGSFGSFVDLSALAPATVNGTDGTTTLKALLHVHVLTHVLGRTLSPGYTIRHGNQSNQIFAVLDFTDVYVSLAGDLSKLLATCNWEDINITANLSDSMRSQSEPRHFAIRRLNMDGTVEPLEKPKEADASDSSKVTSTSRMPFLSVKNTRAIRYLLEQVPKGISSFYHSLGLAIVPRRSDVTIKRNASYVADNLARSVISTLDYRRGDTEPVPKYAARQLKMIGELFLRRSYSMESMGSDEALTLLLFKFFRAGGLDRLNEYLKRFIDLLAKTPEEQPNPDAEPVGSDRHSAAQGVQSILMFYNQITRHKCIADAQQTASLLVKNKNMSEYFVPDQLVVEIRGTVLSGIKHIWNIPDLGKFSHYIVKEVVDVLRMILKGDGEAHALSRKDQARRRPPPPAPEFKLKSHQHVASLTTMGFHQDLSREALFRCTDNYNSAEQYCKLRKSDSNVPRFPIPSSASSESAGQSEAAALASGVTGGNPAAPDARQHEPDSQSASLDQDDDEMSEDSDDEPPSTLPAHLQYEIDAMIHDGPVRNLVRDLEGASTDDTDMELYFTVDDLEDRRAELRTNLLERCLEILSTHSTITFELADLLQAAVAKVTYGTNPRAEWAELLIFSLISLQGDDSSKEAGLKIHAYAHFVALVLQDREFFDAALDQLKENFESLVGWVQIPREKKVDDAPWIEMVLLVIERVLAEDEQPVEIEFKAPPEDDPMRPLPALPVRTSHISVDDRQKLLEAAMELLPKIGKNASLALSVCRVLVILTRHTAIRTRLAEKQNMGLLFLMVRQLGGSADDKIHSSVMLMLRHLIEDDETVRQIMRAEIRLMFETHRMSRTVDIATYTRQLHHLAIRNPDMFVEVSKEMLEIPVMQMGNSARQDFRQTLAQPLALKKDQTAHDAQSAEGASNIGASASVKSAESRSTTTEATDSVVQFLLRELAKFKDVEDKLPLSAADPTSTEGGSQQDNVETSADIEMSDVSAEVRPTIATTPEVKDTRQQSQEESTIFIYRRFILQCLSELLASYTRTKSEFINFSRKTELQPPTPSKPRAGTLNYLLNVLLPVGTLEHKDDEAHMKRLSMSSWASTVLVSLCQKTPERTRTDRYASRAADMHEEEAELTVVRKFVLEHALRSFKEATTSSEPLDMRYSRLLALGDLFNRILSGKSDAQRVSHAQTVAQQQIAKHMYEKNFIGTLTSAIAELDLNFPNAKRVVKYILAPLKQLTELGVHFSTSSDSSSSGPGTGADEDEVSSATSLSEDEDGEEREQTPDLFRGSSLRMFESVDHEDDESEEESDDDGDEDMYDDGYDEEMEYEEEIMAEHGEVVSDDEDEDGMGPIEGVPGDMAMDVEMIMEGEDDEDSDDEDDEDDDDEEDDEDEDDDGDHFDHGMDEITGDDEGASLGEHDDEEDWEDDDEAFENDRVIIEDSGSDALRHMAHVIGAGELIDGDLDEDEMEMGGGDPEYFEDELPPEDDEEDEEEEDEDIDNNFYEPDPDEEDDEQQIWRIEGRAMDGGPAQILFRGAPHHHHGGHYAHPTGLSLPYGMNGFRGLMDFGDGGLRASGFRTHRTAPGGRDEDGLNPLLQRDSSQQRQDPGQLGSGRMAGRRPFVPRLSENPIREFLNAMGPGAGEPNFINVNVQPGVLPNLAGIPAFFRRNQAGQAIIDMDPSRFDDQWLQPMPERLPELRAGGSSDALHGGDFRLSTTMTRWQDEARMLFPGKAMEKAGRVLNSLLRLLLPAAMEAKRQRRIKENAEREALAEEMRKKAEKEEQEREEKAKQEQQAKEAKEREEREARSQEAVGDSTESNADDDQSMSAPSAPTEASRSNDAEARAENAPPERVTISIRGRELDITGLGIDLEYLLALPEDIREDVIAGQIQSQRVQRAQAARTTRAVEEPTSQISREFLDALPPELQAELLHEEEQQRRQRAAEQQRASRAHGAAVAELTNADFLASLDPELRQSLLRDTPEDILAALPRDAQVEARLLGNERRLPHPRMFETDPARILGTQAPRAADEDGQNAATNRQRRPVAQLLEKSGVATLLRLMFVSLNHKVRGNLHSILSDVCKNTQSRAEVINILLSILQDGTADVNAVERSFAHLSLRAKQSGGVKTPQPLKRSLTSATLSTNAPVADISPLNIVQQCLGTLGALANDNPRVPSFFLNEHETATSQKLKMLSKKGKVRETRTSKYPLNALLTLLDRKLITENTAVMESLASLLSHVTHPLVMLLRRAKESQAADNADTGGAVEEQQPHTATNDVPMEEPTASTTEPVSSASEPPVPSSKVSSAAENKKKHRDLAPPEVPEENIRLVVNILAARECPSKTFSDTLDIIKNLSAIPGAREIFGRELIRQGQELGEVLSEDLSGLASQISTASTDAQLQGVALANFSSAGSKQRKILRVLVALDHLFDPKRMPTASTSSNSSSENDKKLKEDMLASFYNTETFQKMWQSLSSCLTEIRNRGNLVNVATILLPLIESLMVVCRNSAAKEQGTSGAGATAPREAPTSMDSLFFNFTEEHRKILNELIRNNPKLMKGNLSVLAKNSKVLEFDNKQNYFKSKLHDRRSEARVAHPSLTLNVRRSDVFMDSYKSLYFKHGDEVKYGKLNIHFNGEEGIDAGGVTREWFTAIARQMFTADYALFSSVASDRTTFHPNPLSEINPSHLEFFKFVGRVIGKALYEGRHLDAHFSRAVYRRILGKSVSLKDMESLDLDYYKSLIWILENDITDVTFESFSVDVERFGVTETIDLIPGGRDIAVTQDNKQEYVRLVVEYRLIKSVQEQLDRLLEGFYDIVPADLISIFNEQELELLISGLPNIDVDDWKNNTEYHNYQANSPQIQWFWRAVRSFDQEERAKLLQFVTGTSRVPLAGFKELEGMNGFARFNIHRDYSSKEKLPSSHTCFNQLDLPEYESYEHLRQQLYTAITTGSEYFGFA